MRDRPFVGASAAALVALLVVVGGPPSWAANRSALESPLRHTDTVLTLATAFQATAASRAEYLGDPSNRPDRRGPSGLPADQDALAGVIAWALVLAWMLGVSGRTRRSFLEDVRTLGPRSPPLQPA